jgi:hypothetical protein
VYVGLRGGRRRSFGASSSKITATCRQLTVLKSSGNLTTMVKQCRELFCPSARKSLPADRPRKGLNHPLIRSNIAGAVGIASLSWPCMYVSRIFQIPSDLVVESQAIDIIDLIVQLIRHQNGVHRSCRNRTSWGAGLSTSEIQWATT